MIKEIWDLLQYRTAIKLIKAVVKTATYIDVRELKSVVVAVAVYLASQDQTAAQIEYFEM